MADVFARRPEVPTMAITSIDDYERAVQRARDLADAEDGTPEHLELLALTAAITLWNERRRQPLTIHGQETSRDQK